MLFMFLDEKSKMTSEQSKLEHLKSLYGLKYKDLKGEVLKCGKDYLSILVHECYTVYDRKQILDGPEPCILKCKVDATLRVCQLR